MIDVAVYPIQIGIAAPVLDRIDVLRTEAHFSFTVSPCLNIVDAITAVEGGTVQSQKYIPSRSISSYLLKSPSTIPCPRSSAIAELAAKQVPMIAPTSNGATLTSLVPETGKVSPNHPRDLRVFSRVIAIVSEMFFFVFLIMCLPASNRFPQISTAFDLLFGLFGDGEGISFIVLFRVKQ